MHNADFASTDPHIAKYNYLSGFHILHNISIIKIFTVNQVLLIAIALPFL